MTGSNSQNMSVAEKLALRLRESEMGSLLGPDEIDQLAREAVQRAFFADKLVPRDYGRVEKHDPEIVQLARTAFKTAFAEQVKPLVRRITESEEFQRALMTAAIATVPEMLRSYGQQLANETAGRAFSASMEKTQEMLRSIPITGAPAF